MRADLVKYRFIYESSLDLKALLVPILAEQDFTSRAHFD